MGDRLVRFHRTLIHLFHRVIGVFDSTFLVLKQNLCYHSLRTLICNSVLTSGLWQSTTATMVLLSSGEDKAAQIENESCMAIAWEAETRLLWWRTYVSINSFRGIRSTTSESARTDIPVRICRALLRFSAEGRLKCLCCQHSSRNWKSSSG